jgi:hypothetical protein
LRWCVLACAVATASVRPPVHPAMDEELKEAISDRWRKPATRRRIVDRATEDAAAVAVATDFFIKERRSNQLSIRRGDMLSLLSPVTDGWRLVANAHGDTGYVPAALIRIRLQRDPVAIESFHETKREQQRAAAIAKDAAAKATVEALMAKATAKAMASKAPPEQQAVANSELDAAAEDAEDAGHDAAEPPAAAPPFRVMIVPHTTYQSRKGRYSGRPPVDARDPHSNPSERRTSDRSKRAAPAAMSNASLLL